MLQKDPTRRPSASDLYEDNIPPLLSAIQVKEGILQPLEPSPPSDEKDMKYLRVDFQTYHNILGHFYMY